MSLFINRIETFLITSLVACIVIGAVTLSGAAMLENLRFARLTSQTYWLVNAVRTIAAQQKTFAQTAGQDLWTDLTGAGQIDSKTSHANPWNADTLAVTVAGDGGPFIRLENQLPANACRHMAFYFLAQKPLELGLLVMEAQPQTGAAWVPLYPVSSGLADRTVTYGCGSSTSRLALVFRIR